MKDVLSEVNRKLGKIDSRTSSLSTLREIRTKGFSHVKIPEVGNILLSLNLCGRCINEANLQKFRLLPRKMFSLKIFFWDVQMVILYSKDYSQVSSVREGDLAL